MNAELLHNLLSLNPFFFQVPCLLTRAIGAVRNTCEATLTSVMESVNILTTLVDKSYVVKNLHGEPIVELDTSADVDEPTIEESKDYLILYRQYEVYVRRMLEELNRLETVAENQNEKFGKLLSDIHQMVFMKLAVPAALVFPKFIEAAKMWTSLQVIESVLLLRRYAIGSRK